MGYRLRLRQQVLESLGWRIHRIWSTDWWLNPEAEMEKLLGRLQSLIDAQEVDEEESPTAEADEVVPEHTTQQSSFFEAQAPIAPLEQAATQALPVYVPVALPSGHPVAFYEASSNRRIEDHLRGVIDGEGPLPEALLFKRVARAWGLERTGSRISERLRGLVPSDIRRTSEGEVTFCWPTGAEPKDWSGVRIAGEAEDSKRHIADVCSQEIAALIRHVLESTGSTPRADLAKAVCRVVGMARTPADAEARVSAVIDDLITARAVAEVDGYVRPV